MLYTGCRWSLIALLLSFCHFVTHLGKLFYEGEWRVFVANIYFDCFICYDRCEWLCNMWFIFIIYTVHRLGYARITHGGLSDTELQMARFEIPDDPDNFKDNSRVTYDTENNLIPEEVKFNKKWVFSFLIVWKLRFYWSRICDNQVQRLVPAQNALWHVSQSR